MLKFIINLQIIEKDKNNGLAKSIISGVTKVIDVYSKVIVIEDDLKTSNNFLKFMNDSLTIFEKELRIASISGYSIPIKLPKDYKFQTYFVKRPFSWGWATWKNRWQEVNWDIMTYEKYLINKEIIRKFKKIGSDLPPALTKLFNGKTDSWYILWAFYHFINKKLSVYPTSSKILNLGFGGSGVHCQSINLFATNIDASNDLSFLFNTNINEQKYFDKCYYNIFSKKNKILQRLKLFKNFEGINLLVKDIKSRL